MKKKERVFSSIHQCDFCHDDGRTMIFEYIVATRTNVTTKENLLDNTHTYTYESPEDTKRYMCEKCYNNELKYIKSSALKRAMIPLGCLVTVLLTTLYIQIADIDYVRSPGYKFIIICGVVVGGFTGYVGLPDILSDLSNPHETVGIRINNGIKEAIGSPCVEVFAKENWSKLKKKPLIG